VMPHPEALTTLNYREVSSPIPVRGS
jgi:hypothetical protein